MFYFHHYMSVALEGMFAWVVTQVSEKGLAGASVKELAESLKSATVRKALAELFDFDLTEEFGTSTPSDLFQRFVGAFEELDANIGRFLDEKIRPTNAFSEDRLESVIRKLAPVSPGSDWPRCTPALLGVTLARYGPMGRRQVTGNWLATASTDPYVDLVPPIVTAGLTRHFGQWWKCQWKDLAEFVLWKYVVQQHQSMSYENRRYLVVPVQRSQGDLPSKLNLLLTELGGQVLVAATISLDPAERGLRYGQKTWRA